jgi:hypothetical protein
MHDKVIVQAQMCVPINSNCDNVKLQNVSLPLTFEVGKWFFDATHHLDVVDICAELFQNPSMYDKVTILTQMMWGTQTDRRTNRRCDFNMPPLRGIKIKIVTGDNCYLTWCFTLKLSRKFLINFNLCIFYLPLSP